MFRKKIIVHHQEVCTSSLQYFTLHLYEEYGRWHDAIDTVSFNIVLCNYSVFIMLSYDRSITSSETSSPQSGAENILFPFLVSSNLLKGIQ